MHLRLIAQTLSLSNSVMSSLIGFVQFPAASSLGLKSSSSKPTASFSGVSFLLSTSRTCAWVYCGRQIFVFPSFPPGSPKIAPEAGIERYIIHSTCNYLALYLHLQACSMSTTGLFSSDYTCNRGRRKRGRGGGGNYIKMGYHSALSSR